MNIKDFQNQIVGDDLARPNLYSIQIGMPRGQTAGGPTNKHLGTFGGFYNGSDQSDVQKGLSMMAKAVSVPGKSIGTIDAKRFGPVFKVANDLIVDTVSMTFMLSEDWREHKFFEGWIAGIMGHVQAGTGHSPHLPIRQLYTVAYYEDYISQVDIIPLDRQGGAVANIVLHEAYPTNVGPVELAWGEAGEIATCNVTWSFRDWFHSDTAGWWADTSGVDEGTQIDSRAATAEFINEFNN